MIAVPKKDPQDSSREYVYRMLRSNIMNLNYQPGSVLSEIELADMLNISRTPIREAILRLAQERLVDIFPQKGTYVSLIDLKHVTESRFIRKTLEKEVVRQACVSFPDDAFFQLQTHLTLQELCIREKRWTEFYINDSNMHGAIFAGCDRERTWEMIQQMSTHDNRVNVLNASSGFELPELLEQHRMLVQAIRDRNPVLGENTVHAHLTKVRKDIMPLLSDFPHWFVQKEYAGLTF